MVLKKTIKSIYSLTTGKFLMGPFGGNCTELLFLRSIFIGAYSTCLFALTTYINPERTNQKEFEWSVVHFIGVFGVVFYYAVNIFRQEFADKFKCLDSKCDNIVTLKIPRTSVYKNHVFSRDATDYVDHRYFNFCFDCVLFNLENHLSFREFIDLTFSAIHRANLVAAYNCSVLVFPARYKEVEKAYLTRIRADDFKDFYHIWNTEFESSQNRDENIVKETKDTSIQDQYRRLKEKVESINSSDFINVGSDIMKIKESINSIDGRLLILENKGKNSG